MKFPPLHGDTLPEVAICLRQLLVELSKDEVRQGEVPTLQVVDNTHVKVTYRGTDGVLRSNTLVLA